MPAIDVFAALAPDPLPGDYNGDNVVDAADYSVWRDGLGTTYVEADYDVWRTNFGATAGSGSSIGYGSAAVPEPASALLMLCALLWCAVGRRRV